MTPKGMLEKLRSFERERKKKWVIGLSALVAGLVVAVWLAFFNVFLSEGTRVSPGEKPAGGGLSFWETMRSGAAFLYGGFRDMAEKVRDAFIRPEVYRDTPQPR